MACLQLLLCVAGGGPGTGELTGQEGPARQLVQEAKLAVREERWQSAADLLTRVTDANPTRASHWGMLARARREVGDFHGSREALERERGLGGRSASDITFDVARSFGLEGRDEEALAALERAFAEGLRHHRTARSDPAFAGLSDDPRYRELTGTPSTPRPSRSDGWRADVRFLARSLESMHYDLYARADPDRFAAYRDSLWDAVPDLSDDEITVRMMRLVRMAGDAHTNLFPEYVYQYAREGLPVTFFLFQEGLFVERAAPAQARLVGAEVVEVEGRPAAAVLDSIGQIVSRDNRMWVDLQAANLVSFPRILHALGLAASPERLAVRLRMVDGEEETVELPVVPGRVDERWVDVRPAGMLTATRSSERYWFEHVPELDATYLQFNGVVDAEDESLSEFLDRMFDELDARAEHRVVIDLRENRGGNLNLALPLLHGLVARPRFRERGSLYVIVGRKTFSAAMYTAAQLERHLDPVFVGEPTGSSPNFVGETVYVRLPYSGLEPSISNIAWQGSHGADRRTWIGPHLYAPPSMARVLEGVDPALEAIRRDIGSGDGGDP
jgi:hypothetical protein